jgi:hypothetical protein
MAESGGTTISSLTNHVATQLRSLLKTQASKEAAPAFDDVYERFQLWSSNIGAHHDSSKSISMDYRVRNVPELQAEVCMILHELTDVIDEGK